MKTSRSIVLLLLFLAFMVTQAQGYVPVNEQNESEVAVVDYTILDRADLYDNTQLAGWHEHTHRNLGIYSLELEGDTYVIVSAGTRSSGGYSLQLETVTLADENTLTIAAQLITPQPGDLVTMALTYPHLVLHFPNQTFAELALDLDAPDQPGHLSSPRLNLDE